MEENTDPKPQSRKTKTLASSLSFDPHDSLTFVCTWQ